jgi:RNA polymerase sigma factor (sigma-70 family)
MTSTSVASSDAELLTRVRSGDEAAYGELYERHAEVARKVAYGLAGAHRAEDLVAEAFAKVLGLLRRGQGPDLAFRPYLIATIRTVHLNGIRAAKRETLVDDYASVGAEDSVGLDVDGLFEEAAIGRAYATLPERWRAVLWLTAVECRSNDEVGEMLGIKPNAVSALSFRAREGLRQAYLADHLQVTAVDSACAETVEAIPGYLRGTLGKRKQAAVEEHLDECGRCALAAAEASQVNTNLGALLAPALLGSAAAHEVWPHLWSGGTGKAAAELTGSSAKLAAAKLVAAAVVGTFAVSGLVASEAVFDSANAAVDRERVPVSTPNVGTQEQAARSVNPPAGLTHSDEDVSPEPGPVDVIAGDEEIWQEAPPEAGRRALSPTPCPTQRLRKQPPRQKKPWSRQRKPWSRQRKPWSRQRS